MPFIEEIINIYLLFLRLQTINCKTKNALHCPKYKVKKEKLNNK